MTKSKTKHFFQIAMPLAGIISLIIFPPWLLIKAWLMPLPDTIQEQVDEAISYGIEGMIVYVDEARKEPALYAAGWKNRENKVPADAHSLFKIASISKLYIAVAVAKMTHANRLSLDKSLAEYLPEFADRIENSEQITLRMLVQHRSGIPNFVDHPDFPWDNLYKKTSDTYQLVFDQPADFAPDKKYRYSNTNYLLIGDILDKTLGYSHHRYIREEILVPLGLSHTYSLLSEVDLDEVMSGYSVGYEPDIKPNDYIIPGGSMVATAEDVGIFLRALNDGSLLTEEEQAIYSSIYEYGHTGLLPGYQSHAFYHPDIDAVVIQFVNTSGGVMWNVSEIFYNRIVKILKKQE
ncbi:serine hydrolase domain-containing protein [Algoriphagus jejuensis]|uniref:Serine hydrolase domain-containing protein n=1 Tax=Algoriphagus jejuensis TaxID=419934 RepID=A0ABP3YI70_9BACT